MTELRTVDALRIERIAFVDDMAELRRLETLLAQIRARLEKRRKLIDFLSAELALEVLEESHAGAIFNTEGRD
jgi:hypothetical protein